MECGVNVSSGTEDFYRRDLCLEIDKFVQLLSPWNSSLHSWDNKALSRFEQHSMTKKQEILSQFRTYHQVVKKTILAGISPDDNKETLRFSMQVQDIHIPEEFIDTLVEEDLIEVYSLDGLQIFRNIKFFEISGYTLFDLVTNPWPDLYERSHSETTNIEMLIENFLKSGQSCLNFDIGRNLMRERFSSTEQLNEVRFRYIAPTFSMDSQLSGFVLSSQAKIIQEAEENNNLEFI